MSTPTCGDKLRNGRFYFCERCHQCDPSHYPAPSSPKLDRLHEDFHNFMQAFSKDVVHLRKLITEIQADITRIDANGVILQENIVNANKVMNDNFDITERRFRRLR